jgi:hypothetical protein
MLAVLIVPAKAGEVSHATETYGAECGTGVARGPSPTFGVGHRAKSGFYKYKKTFSPLKVHIDMFALLGGKTVHEATPGSRRRWGRLRHPVSQRAA